MGSPQYWGNTKTQALSVFTKLKQSFESLGVGFGDVVHMTVYLVADPANKDGRMDFQGFMDAYTQFFGTPQQPHLPSRSAVQVAGLAAPGLLVEVEVEIAKPKK
jgi:enamine deaminase RidA (YjgF/YER057c/UK114 family)